MATVANYYAVRDTRFMLSVDVGYNSMKDLPLRFDNLDYKVESVLSYMVAPGSSGMTFNMSIVRHMVDYPDEIIPVISSTTLPSHVAHVRQEVIEANVFWPGNELRIQVTSGSGSFYDIVIWYKSKVKPEIFQY